MFNDDAFSKIKKGARIVNVARGGVIDDAALGRALDAGQVAQVRTLPTALPLAGCLLWPSRAAASSCCSELSAAAAVSPGLTT